MFGLISTKDLYLIELATIEDIKLKNNRLTYHYSLDRRFTLARKDYYTNDYIDIFTNTKYELDDIKKLNFEYIINLKVILTEKKYLTKKETVELLESLNPTYISHKKKKNNNSKVITKRKDNIIYLNRK